MVKFLEFRIGKCLTGEVVKFVKFVIGKYSMKEIVKFVEFTIGEYLTGEVVKFVKFAIGKYSIRVVKFLSHRFCNTTDGFLPFLRLKCWYATTKIKRKNGSDR